MYFSTDKFEFVHGHKPGGRRQDWVFGDPEGQEQVSAPGGMSFIEAKKWFKQQYPGYKGKVVVLP